FDGRTSSRSCATTLSKVMRADISHQKVLHVLDLASEAAATLNYSNLALTPVSCAAFDEIFQRQEPILGFVAPLSAVIYIQAANDRSGETWAVFLKFLKELGLDPKATVTDGGSGLLKGIRDVFSEAVQLRDLFHVLYKLSKAKRALEGRCYAMIAAEIKLLGSTCGPEIVDAHRIKMNDALTQFDLIEANIREIRKACYLSDDESPCYVTAAALRAIVKKCLRHLEIAGRTVSDHRAIKEAMTYLESGLKSISAYKEMIETVVLRLRTLSEGKHGFANDHAAME
ncbi:MAG: transposase, partial [Pseudobdellovibrionaceae bacterium]|nr:transposase [Pseudobdellovibrionaceae bacterium]